MTANDYVQLIDKLADKLGVPTQYILQAYIERAHWLWIWSIAPFLVTIVAGWLCWKMTSRGLKLIQDDNDEGVGWLIFAGIFGFVSFSAFCMFAGWTVSAVIAANAPEAYALDHVLKIFK